MGNFNPPTSKAISERYQLDEVSDFIETEDNLNSPVAGRAYPGPTREVYGAGTMERRWAERRGARRISHQRRS